jgi:alkanesulfonate monooxygenase
MRKIEWGWAVPIDGDSEHVGTLIPEITPNINYIIDTIRTAEKAGFEIVLVPTSFKNSLFAEDAPRAESIVATSVLAAMTKKIRLLLAFKTGEIHPALFAKMCADIDQISNGRLAINVTSGGGSIEAQYGETLDHDSRYERTLESVKLWKLLWTQARTTFRGKYMNVENAVLEPKPIQKAGPPLYFVGTSEIARTISAEHGDVHLFQGDTPARIKVNIDDFKGRASRFNRTLRYAVRLQVVVRSTEQKAWKAVRKLMSRVDPLVIATRANTRALNTQETEHRDLVAKALSGDSMMAPNIWGGLHAVKGGAGTVLVGDPKQLTERIMDYVKVGVSCFILSSYPMKREAKRVGELLIPMVEERMEKISYKWLER